ncbi:hypothetical protein CGRA01v4_09014 [Colletotrichum graminicola]|nr:hypothetical protein CGRA01v4_09014 [Colletotrichum graminicola]
MKKKGKGGWPTVPHKLESTQASHGVSSSTNSTAKGRVQRGCLFRHVTPALSFQMHTPILLRPS